MRKIILSALMSLVLLCFGVDTLAANVPYNFTLHNTDTAYNVYGDQGNIKVYANDSSTVKTTDNNVPGYGTAFCMKHKYGDSYITDTVTSPGQWISGCGTIHPPYLYNHNVTNRTYYVAARIDNDYSGTYYVAGSFNSDYTNP